MSNARFIQSITANIVYWREHEGLADPHAWRSLDQERGNLFLAAEFGFQQQDTWPEAAELALSCYTYVFERGYWSEWVPVLEQAIHRCPDEYLITKGQLLNQLGGFLRKLRRLNEAQAAHEQAATLGRAAGDPMLVARAELGLGRVFLRLRQHAKAERFARLALTSFETEEVPRYLAAHAHNLLGIIALRRGDYAQSAGEFHQACGLFRRSQQYIELGRTSANLCEALTRLSRVEEALALFEETATIFTQYDLQLELSRLYINLGFLHYNQGDLGPAETAFRQAYSPAMRRAGPVYLRSLNEMNLGNVLLQQGHPEEARPYFNSAVTGFRLVEARTLLANSLDGLAEIAIAFGERKAAATYYAEALDIVSAIPEDAIANRMEKRFRGLLEELRPALEEEE